VLAIGLVHVWHTTTKIDTVPVSDARSSFSIEATTSTDEAGIGNSPLPLLEMCPKLFGYAINEHLH
jgi:hypothetical protein